MVSGVAGDTEVMTFDSADLGIDGPISLSVGDDGVASVFGDRFGDGLGAGGSMSIQFGDDHSQPLTGARLPRPMQRADADRVVRQLGGSVPEAVVRQLFDDYAAKAAEAERTTADLARESLKGSTIALPGDTHPETPLESVARGIEALAGWDAALAAAVAAFVAAAGTAAGAAPDVVARATADRAWARIHELHYPRAPEREFALANDPAPSVLDVVLAAQLADADRAAALGALDAWLPGAMAAAGAVRAAERESAVDEIRAERERMRKMQERMREQAATAKAGDGATVAGFAIAGETGAGDGADAGTPRRRRFDESIQAARAQVATARDAVGGAVSDTGKPAFTAAWKRALAPKAYADAKDATVRIDAVLRDPALPAAQRAQVEALRTEHAAAHAALDERIADAMVEQALASAMTGDAEQVAAMLRRDQSIAESRFERAELNARTLRRLRAIVPS
jgi:hypothetical protein